MLCHTENMAPGTVAMARAENAVAARLVASPEFCMPISMERNIAITSTFTVVRSSKYVIGGVKIGKSRPDMCPREPHPPSMRRHTSL